jgi:hypothetical protein
VLVFSGMELRALLDALPELRERLNAHTRTRNAHQAPAPPLGETADSRSPHDNGVAPPNSCNASVHTQFAGVALGVDGSGADGSTPRRAVRYPSAGQ